MHRLWRTITLITWGLWFGGLVTLFISVVTLFRFDHAMAAQAAPQLFHVFERYQLVLAAVAMVSAIAGRRVGLGILFALASAGALVSPLVLTPRILEMQRQGLTHTDAFARLHGQSMMVYTADAALLLVVGLILANKASHFSAGNSSGRARGEMPSPSTAASAK